MSSCLRRQLRRVVYHRIVCSFQRGRSLNSGNSCSLTSITSVGVSIILKLIKFQQTHFWAEFLPYIKNYVTQCEVHLRCFFFTHTSFRSPYPPEIQRKSVFVMCSFPSSRWNNHSRRVCSPMTGLEEPNKIWDWKVKLLRTCVGDLLAVSASAGHLT